jgi:hypothetical protein
MATQQANSHGAAADEQGVRLRESLIGQHVMRALGPPDGLHSVQIRALWGHCFRVNVLIGADAVTSKVVHSYFLVTDGRGKVVASTPTIVRQYGDGGPSAPDGALPLTANDGEPGE